GTGLSSVFWDIPTDLDPCFYIYRDVHIDRGLEGQEFFGDRFPGGLCDHSLRFYFLSSRSRRLFGERICPVQLWLPQGKWNGFQPFHSDQSIYRPGPEVFGVGERPAHRDGIREWSQPVPLSRPDGSRPDVLHRLCLCLSLFQLVLQDLHYWLERDLEKKGDGHFDLMGGLLGALFVRFFHWTQMAFFSQLYPCS